MLKPAYLWSYRLARLDAECLDAEPLRRRPYGNKFRHNRLRAEARTHGDQIDDSTVQELCVTLAPYSVLGSCVTRDAVDLASTPLERPVHYFSRTKLQSLVSTPTEIPDDIGLSSSFQTRVVVEDHRKSAMPVLKALDHALVIDLIDERLGLLDSGTGLVTESLYLRHSPVLQQEAYKRVREDRTVEAEGPFELAARNLAQQLSIAPRVVIHEALWATTARDGSALPDARKGERMNDWLRRAYARLREAFPGAIRVVPDPAVVLADPEHRWGLAAFHYVPEYYDDVAAKIREALCSEDVLQERQATARWRERLRLRFGDRSGR